MCSTTKSILKMNKEQEAEQPQEQRQKYQNKIFIMMNCEYDDYSFLRQHDVDPRTALSACRREDQDIINPHHITTIDGKLNNFNNLNINCIFAYPANNKNNNNNSNNKCNNNKNTIKKSIKIIQHDHHHQQIAQSCKGRSNSTNKYTNSNNKFLKFHIFLFGILCISFGVTSVQAIPRHRVGRDLIIHPQHHQRQQHSMAMDSLEEAVSNALKQARDSAEALNNLTDNYFQDQYRSDGSKLEELWGWHDLNVAHPYANKNKSYDFDFAADDWHFIKKELYNITEALGLLRAMFNGTNQYRKANRNKNLQENHLDDELTRNVDNFFKISFEIISFNLNELYNILTKLEKGEEHLKFYEGQMERENPLSYQDHQLPEYAIAAEHMRVLPIIRNFYAAWLRGLNASKSSSS